MSKKNLSRTVIEGGRSKSNKWDRRYSHQETRAREKNFLTEVKGDLENYYEYDIEPTRHVYKGFTDKLGPMYRWLESQLGKPWNDVRSEVTKTFDTRTTAGRHIVYDHLLSSVEVTPDVYRLKYLRKTDDPNTSYFKNDFFVNEEGILCKRRYVRRHEKIVHINTNQLVNWLNCRVVGYAGKKLFWFVPTGKNQWACNYGGNGYYYGSRVLQYYYLYDEPIYLRNEDGSPVLNQWGKAIITDYETKWRAATPVLRQDRRLNEKELAYWNSLPEHYRTKVMEYSPNYVAPEKPNNYYYY